MAGTDRPHRPRKRFGQHFLADPRALDRIVRALAPDGDDTIVEIGPGRGALTVLLSAACKRLVGIEIDRDLVRHLRERFQDQPQVEIVEGDALEIDWRALASGPYLLAGNLPYYITTPLIFRILEHPRPGRAVLLVQREVAERLSAAPGSSDYGALTVNVQVSVTVEMVGRVPAGAFHPRPRVDSAIVLLTPRKTPLLGAEEEGPFRKFVQAAFGMRRKQLVRVLREMGATADYAVTTLGEMGVDPSARPETLDPAAFVQLYGRTAALKER